ncbi:GNAT family N-acetyltransferase [Rhodococcus aerolatus]
MPVLIRPRRPEDVPVLAEVLAEQQPRSRYPYRWPFPTGAQDFLVRSYEQVAWVAERDGEVVGHVMVGRVDRGGPGDAFRRGTGCDDPAIVSVLFVGTSARGTGVGGLLLDTAVAWARAAGRVPVLDVVPLHGSALAVYEHRGWVRIGTTRFDWLSDEEPDVVLMALPPFPALGSPA